jgi:hypothetical protein
MHESIVALRPLVETWARSGGCPWLSEEVNEVGALLNRDNDHFK